MNTCLFCGPTAAAITKEERWPKWLNTFLHEHEPALRKYEVTRRLTHTGEVRQWNAPTFESTAVKNVCVKCNNETLSDLENHIKPVLTRMLLEEQTELTAFEQTALCAWITRYAMLADEMGFFTAADRKRFITTLEPPTDSWIWIAPFNTKRLPIGGTNARIPLADGSTAYVASSAVYRMVFQFLTRRWPKNKRPTDDRIAWMMSPILKRWPDVTIQLQPPVYDVAKWPTPACIGDGSVRAFMKRWNAGLPKRVSR